MDDSLYEVIMETPENNLISVMVSASSKLKANRKALKDYPKNIFIDAILNN